jgi:DNA mismatch endonuclease, patch repair protein
MDTLTTAERSARMARVRSHDTKPEMVVRRGLHRMGFRYLLHDRRLPGSPDLVFPSRQAVIFVHGCFWHRHEDCRLARLPKSRVAFWEEKLDANRTRDARAIRLLEERGWRVLVLWECELRDPSEAIRRAADFLGSPVGDPRRVSR